MPRTSTPSHHTSLPNVADTLPSGRVHAMQSFYEQWQQPCSAKPASGAFGSPAGSPAKWDSKRSTRTPERDDDSDTHNNNNNNNNNNDDDAHDDDARVKRAVQRLETLSQGRAQSAAEGKLDRVPKSYFFVPVFEKERLQGNINSPFTAHAMLPFEQVEAKLLEIGFPDRLDRFASLSKLDFATTTLRNAFPFNSSPKKLARFLTLRDRQFWTVVQLSHTGRHKDPEEFTDVFETAIAKHNRLYEIFNTKLLGYYMSTKEKQRNAKYFVEFMIQLIYLRSYSLFFTCGKLLLDVSDSTKIEFSGTRALDVLDALLAIYGALVASLPERSVRSHAGTVPSAPASSLSASSTVHSTPSVSSARTPRAKRRISFDRLHADPANIKMQWSTKEFSALTQFFEAQPTRPA